jgi:hypothetical protein
MMLIMTGYFVFGDGAYLVGGPVVIGLCVYAAEWFKYANRVSRCLTRRVGKKKMAQHTIHYTTVSVALIFGSVGHLNSIFRHLLAKREERQDKAVGV